MIGITATQAEMDELLEERSRIPTHKGCKRLGGTMNFKKGDLVECWDHDVEKRENCEYFGFNDYPKACFPYLVYRLGKDGKLSDIFIFKHCRHTRPSLEIDAPVWVRIYDNWEPRHFAGWVDDGRMKYWSTGMTSHTAPTSNAWYVVEQYRLTPPDKGDR